MKINRLFLDKSVELGDGLRRRIGDPVCQHLPTINFAAGTPVSGGYTIDTMYAWPYPIDQDVKFDQINSWNQANVGVSGYRMGLYTDDGNFTPHKLIKPTDVSAYTGAAGLKTGNFSSSVKLKKGHYWFVFLTASTANMRKMASGLAYISSVLGVRNSGGAFVCNTCLTVGFTFAALPDYYPLGYSFGSDAPPYVTFRTIR